MKYRYFDIGDILSVGVVLVMLAVGLFTFNTVINSITPTTTNKTISDNSSFSSLQNISALLNPIFNLLPIILTVSFIMIIISSVCKYSYSSFPDDEEPEKDKKEVKPLSQLFGNEPIEEKIEPKPIQKIKFEEDKTRKRYSWNRGKE